MKCVCMCVCVIPQEGRNISHSLASSADRSEAPEFIDYSLYVSSKLVDVEKIPC